MNSDDETYILLLLSDSNLPTGSFVASSGLESYIKHGFGYGDSNKTVTFIQDSIASYARSALPFVSDAHRLVSRFRSGQIDNDSDNGGALEDILSNFTSLDELYHTMTLNHVTRRASKSQGVALLTLYSKGFSRPPSFPTHGSQRADSIEDQAVFRMENLVDRLKLTVRKEETHGHLPVCWGLLTAALGLTLGALATVPIVA